jgi:hypothetical protein
MVSLEAGDDKGYLCIKEGKGLSEEGFLGGVAKRAEAGKTAAAEICMW